MEQAQYWMWMKRRELFKSHVSQATMNSFSDSWEERAFAEDAADSLGGCVWPPRSYSCSFCKREFKSAQALGGHMNVHRRDRARLKQSLTLHNEVLHQENHNQNSPHSLEPKCPSENCTSDYNLDHTTYPSNIIASTTLSPNRVSALPSRENLSENTLVSPDSSSFVQGKVKGASPCAYTSSWSNSVVKTLLNISDSKPEPERHPAEEDSISVGHDYYVETNLSVGLNSVFCRDRPTESCGDEAISCKRTKTAAVATLPFFLSNDKYGLHMEVLGLRSTSKENLDLELRLGDPPKVK